jgi:hypothetical protein
MAQEMPPVASQELVPIVWKEHWAPMKPFLLDQSRLAQPSFPVPDDGLGAAGNLQLAKDSGDLVAHRLGAHGHPPRRGAAA